MMCSRFSFPWAWSMIVTVLDICNGSGSAPSTVCDFLLCLASTSPVCSYVHYDERVRSLITDISSGVNIKQSPSKWAALRTGIPVVFKVLCDNTVTSVPLSLSNLLVELWNRCEATFAFVEPIVVDGDVTEDDVSFFPSMPKCRNRGVFAADTMKGGRKADNCTKQYRGHPTLLPGIFTMYCQHGICYGFQVMPNHESPNVPFTIMRTRFTTAPSVVVYDNACSLHQYVLNRDPYFFRNTKFFVDRLHWHNHTGCGVGYCLAIYPDFELLNSQMNEQANAGLKRIKDQLSYMNTSNFMRHCSFYLWNKNRLKRLANTCS